VVMVAAALAIILTKTGVVEVMAPQNPATKG
jgi:hypothetical protein